jgi:hypothetical protein
MTLRRLPAVGLVVVLVVSFHALLLGLGLALVVGLAVATAHGPVVMVGVWAVVAVVLVGSRRSLAALIPSRVRRPLPGVELGRVAEPVIWALVDSVSGQLGQPRPDGVRVVLEGRATVTGGTVILPICNLVGLSCAELRVVIAGELGRLAGGARGASWIGTAADSLSRTMVGLERERSVLRYPLRPYARAFFGLTRRLAGDRAASGEAIAANAYGRDLVVCTRRRTESVAIGFDWFWRAEVKPFLERGWRPPIAASFAAFLDAPDVRKRGLWLSCDEPTGDLLQDAEAVETALLGAQAGSLVAVDWQDAAARIALIVWADHARQDPRAGAGVRVWEVGQVVEATIGACAGDEPRLRAAMVSLGAGLALALAGDGWRVGRLPGRTPSLCKGGVVIAPDVEIARLWSGRLTAAAWIDRCAGLGIGDLRVVGGEPETAWREAARAHAGTAAS